MTTPRICETVVGPTVETLVRARDAVVAADMVELRLDGVEDVDAAGALSGRRLPAVVTCRPTWEGGRFDGPEHVRYRILHEALAAGAEFVDVEWRALSGPEGPAFQALLAAYSDRVVLSSHDFSGVPSDLPARVRAMRATGAAVVKVAVTVERLSESLVLREVAAGGPAVVIAMGEAGVPSRLLAGRFGAVWTYGGHGVAPGQIPAEQMVHTYRFREVGPGTRIYGIVGTNALHSFSPAMHNAAFTASGQDAVYVPLRAASFEDFAVFADALGLAGASVTIPYKVDALRAAASADALTLAVGAANTLRRVGGGWDATNTDVPGFLAPLAACFPAGLAQIRAAILGAGGSARAVAAALRSAGALVTIHARRREQASTTAADLGVHAADWPPVPGSWDLLVNTTPLGGAGQRDVSPVAAASLDGGVVYDLTYGPEPSRLIREAGAAGCQTLDGLPMLVAQAERQFEWWMGQAPPAGVMAAAARDCVRRAHGNPDREE